MIPSSLGDSISSSRRHDHRVRQVADLIRESFLVTPSTETPERLEALAREPVVDIFPEKLGAAMINCVVRDANVLSMMLVPVEGKASEQRSRQRILALNNSQRAATAEYVRLLAELGGWIAQYGWVCLWSDISAASGDMTAVWDHRSDTLAADYARGFMTFNSIGDSYFFSKRHSARIKKLAIEIRDCLIERPLDVIPELPIEWRGLAGTPLEQFPEQLGFAMLAQLSSYGSFVNAMMLCPFPKGDKWEQRVRECILSLTSQQRMVAAKYLQLRMDLGDSIAKRAWFSLWRDIYDASGEVSDIWGDIPVSY